MSAKMPTVPGYYRAAVYASQKRQRAVHQIVCGRGRSRSTRSQSRQERKDKIMSKNDNKPAVSVGIIDEQIFLKIEGEDGEGLQVRLSPDEARAIHNKLGRALEYFKKPE